MYVPLITRGRWIGNMGTGFIVIQNWVAIDPCQISDSKMPGVDVPGQMEFAFYRAMPAIIHPSRILNLCLVFSTEPQKVGEDGYGTYFNMTGFEAPGRCFWCGAELKGGRRYCPGHGKLYREAYHWSSARTACYRRHNLHSSRYYRDAIYFCDDCGFEDHDDRKFAVHHIQPVGGFYRVWNKLNRQDNLVLLCHECHNRRHGEMRINS